MDWARLTILQKPPTHKQFNLYEPYKLNWVNGGDQPHLVLSVHFHAWSKRIQSCRSAIEDVQEKPRMLLSMFCYARGPVPSLPHNFGVFADDVQLEHISAFHALDQPERHLWMGGGGQTTNTSGLSKHITPCLTTP